MPSSVLSFYLDNYLDKNQLKEYKKYNKSYFRYNSETGGMNMAHPEGKYIWTATVGEKGQIVIPKQAREIFGINPGDTLILLGNVNRGIAIPPKTSFAEYFKRAFDGKEDE